MFYARKEEKNKDESYSSMRHRFISEYRRSNTVTKNKALQEFNLYVKSRIHSYNTDHIGGRDSEYSENKANGETKIGKEPNYGGKISRVFPRRNS